MARSRFGHWPLLLGAVIGLAGCEQTAAGRDGAELPPAQARGQRVTERDIQAPELFEASENGLWDGRPSLGGVWVAHPDVRDPQRVMIRNAVTGKTIIGALFRRERANPGPRFQLSSDAAEELGILAGQPTMLSVVALKREQVAEPAAEMPISDEVPAEAGDATPAAGAAVAAAAAGSGAGTAGPDAAAAVEPQPVPEDAPPTSFGRRRPPPAAAPEAADDLAAPAAGPAGPAGPAAAADPAAAAEPQPVPEDAPPTSFGRRRAAAAAGATVGPAGPAGGDISVAPIDGAAPAAAAAAAPAAAPLDRPYIQAAIFGAEAGANSVAERLRGAGLTASVRRTDVSGTIYWRVIAGPAANAAERAEILGKVKELGYSDAYPVRG